MLSHQVLIKNNVHNTYDKHNTIISLKVILIKIKLEIVPNYRPVRQYFKIDQSSYFKRLVFDIQYPLLVINERSGLLQGFKLEYK